MTATSQRSAASVRHGRHRRLTTGTTGTSADAQSDDPVTAAHQALAAIDEALSTLVGQPLSGAVDDEALLASVERLQRLETCVQAERLRRIAEADARKACAGQARTTADWLVQRLSLSRGEAKADLDTAVALRHLPQTAAAMARGDLGIGQAREAARAWNELNRLGLTGDDGVAQGAGGSGDGAVGGSGSGDGAVGGSGSGDDAASNGHLDPAQDDPAGGTAADGPLDAGEDGCPGASEPGSAGDADGQPTLDGQLDALAAEQGRRQDRHQLRRSLDEWAHEHASSDRLGERERSARQRRRLRLGGVRSDGIAIVDGRLDGLGQATVRAALESLARPDGADDPRTLEQRRADALVELAERHLNGGQLPEVAAQRPHVVVTTSLESLIGKPGAAPAHLDGVGPISSASARLLTCDADVSEVVVRNDEILDVGRRRQPSRAQRIALIARDGGCIGCSAPVVRCQVHHIHHWADGGLTNLSNLCLICWGCHHRIHHHGWQVRYDASAGRFRLRPPSSDSLHSGGEPSEPGAAIQRPPAPSLGEDSGGRRSGALTREPPTDDAGSRDGFVEDAGSSRDDPTAIPGSRDGPTDVDPWEKASTLASGSESRRPDRARRSGPARSQAEAWQRRLL